jgi:AraC-like DNA-binding protein
MHYELDLSTYTCDQRLDVWEQHLAASFGPCSIAALTSVQFHGRLKGNARKQIAFSEVDHGGVVISRTRKHVAHVVSEDLYLVHPLAGAFWLELGAVERTIEPGQICLRNLSVPHRSAVIALDILCLKIPALPLQHRLPVLDPFYQVMKAADPMRYNLLASFMDYFGENLDHWSEEEFTQLSAHLYDLIGLLILRPNIACPEGEMSIRIAHRERAIRYIRENLADPNIKPIAVAEACGISIRYLYEIFKLANLGVEEFILDERIKHSRDLLNDTRNFYLPVSEIGQMVGFKDTSHFIRCFRRHFGVTPGDFRVVKHY